MCVYVLTNVDSTDPPCSCDIVITIFAREICIRSIRQDTSRSSIMHQIFSKQESAHTHRHPPYFPSLHLVHHHNSVLKTSYNLSATRLSFDPIALEQRAFLSACVFSRNELQRQSCICLYRILRRESRKSRERTLQRETDTAFIFHSPSYRVWK